MNIYHKINWDKCLSHQMWPAFQKGWPETDKPVHFFWGLAGNNRKEIAKCMENGEEWWYVDVGYLTEQITRYPEPIIHDYDKTYFRIVKGGLHTIRGSVGDGKRVKQISSKGIDVDFKGWDTGDEKRNHILVCPSSTTVCHEINGMTQEQWIEETVAQIKQYTDKEIVVRNKPRPGNQWWGKHIKDDLSGAHCLVTNMSLAAVDAIMNYTPCITHIRNVASPVSGRKIELIEKPFRPGRKTVYEWLRFIVDNQFNLSEIENGTAYELLRKQNVGTKST